MVYLGYWLVVGSYVYRSYRETKELERVPGLQETAVEQVAS
jgi:hypothetical protein